MKHLLTGKSLEWAITTCKVDIISISWGLNEDIANKEIAKIKSLINEAYLGGVIILAAASNSGENEAIPFRLMSIL